ncbi:MAG: HepT-like ribonuclease domain-containing protein [Pseudanabaena sp. ELA607]
MSKIDDSTRLHHMLDAASEAVTFVQGKSREDLDSDRLLSLGLVRLLEIVCEAATKVSKEKQAALPNIYWKQITGMRNRVAHAYFGIDLDVVWQTIAEDFPLLIAQLEEIIPNEDESNPNYRQYS